MVHHTQKVKNATYDWFWADGSHIWWYTENSAAGRKHCDDEWNCESCSSSAKSIDLENVDSDNDIHSVQERATTFQSSQKDLPKQFTADELCFQLILQHHNNLTSYSLQLFGEYCLQKQTDMQRIVPLIPSGHKITSLMEFAQVAVKCVSPLSPQEAKISGLLDWITHNLPQPLSSVGFFIQSGGSAE